MTIIESERVMDQVTEEKARKEHFHNHALKGDLEKIGAIPLAHDQAENNPHNEKSKRKKNERYAETLHAITQAQEAYGVLMDRLDVQLTALRTVIEEVENDMNQNRFDWDKQVEILDDIDEVFSDFEDGGYLNPEKAKTIFDKAGIEIPNGMTDAKMITFLQDLRGQTIKKVDDLDAAFLILEEDHKRFRAREDKVIAAKQKLEAIGNDSSLSDEAKLTAIKTLDTEVGSKTMHRAATITQNEEVATKADEVVIEGRHEIRKADTMDFNKISVQSLNF